MKSAYISIPVNNSNPTYYSLINELRRLERRSYLKYFYVWDRNYKNTYEPSWIEDSGAISNENDSISI